jgi:hypothetical protein
MRSYWLREHQSCRNDTDGSPHNHTPSPRDLFPHGRTEKTSDALRRGEGDSSGAGFRSTFATTRQTTQSVLVVEDMARETSANSRRGVGSQRGRVAESARAFGSPPGPFFCAGRCS